MRGGSAFGIVLGVAIVGVGCLPDRADSIDLDDGRPPPPLEFDEPRIVIENRTDDFVDITTLESSDLIVDHRVIDGALSLPFGDSKNGFRKQQRKLAPRGTLQLVEGEIYRFGDGFDANVHEAGGILRIGDGASFLAIGTGRIFIVPTSGGPPTFEVEDPQKVSLRRADESLPQCPDGVTGQRIQGLPYSWPSSKKLPVTSVTRYAGGCVTMRFDDPMGQTFDVNVCLPEGAFPFAQEDKLVVGPPMFDRNESGVRIEGTKGAVELLHLDVWSRAPIEIGAVSIASDIEPRCVRVDPECGDVLVPSRLDVSVDGKAVPDMAFGSALVSADNATRSVYVLGAISRPISVASCTTRPLDVSNAAGEAFVVVVER